MATQTTIAAARREPWVAVVEALVDAAGVRAAFEHDTDFHLSIENAPYMRLVIEAHDAPAAYTRGTLVKRVISFAHYFEKASPLDDTIADTDVEFLDDGRILNLTYAGGRLFTTVRWVYGGEPKVDRYAERDTKSFVRLWARNLRHQGFIQAARALRQSPQ